MTADALGSIARTVYHSARGLGSAWDWYRESDERSKFVHILEAVDYLRIAGMPPVFFEFGCHSGRTFSAALLAARLFRMRLDAYAFDSFQGLPANDEGTTTVFKAGSFRTDRRSFERTVRRRTGVRLSADHMIEGFYDTTLTAELSRRLPAQVGFVHIDVDLYKSTVPVLDFIRDKLVPGAVVLFDDWFCFPTGQGQGEERALAEFCQRNPGLKLELWKNYSGFGRSFFVVSGASAAR
jgi:O-methyltransferase